MKDGVRIGLATAAVLLAHLQPALAQAPREAMLHSATCDGLRHTVRIEGRHLEFPAIRPAIFLAGHDSALVVREVADSHIVAVLPEGLGDGVYRVRVRSRGDRWLEVPLTIGIVGPVIVE